jgi:REP element-mobilizing transposase RayT
VRLVSIEGEPVPHRATVLVPGSWYHIYNRGVASGPIYLSADHYALFLRGIMRFMAPGEDQVIAYCLMPNHYHLLLRMGPDDLSGAMQRLAMSYVNAFNFRLGRSGPMFHGRFQAKLVDRDDYLLHLTRYIHRNPVDALLVRRAEDWPYSSYRDYIDVRRGEIPSPGLALGILSPGLPNSKAQADAYRGFVEYDERPIACPAPLLIDTL